MSIKFITSTSILSLALTFFLVNALSDQFFSKYDVDFTEEGLYTLSPGTRATLSELQDPITLKFYYSKTEGDAYPVIKLYGSWISDLLTEYKQVSGGQVHVEVIDPRPDSEDEEWAERYGITPFSLPTGEKIFLGLVGINSEGVEDVIPAFNLNRQEYLEYDITKLLYSLKTSAQVKIGVLSALPMDGAAPARPQASGAGKEWVVLSQLKKLAEVVMVPMNVTAIPDDIQVLLVVHPRGITEQATYAIDQFVLRGGNLLLAVDPYAMSDAPQGDPSNPLANFTTNRSSELNVLTSAWGATLTGSQVVTDRNLATPVATQPGQVENFIAWLTFSPRGQGEPIINRDNVMTSQLENIMFAWSGAFEVVETEGVQSEVLMWTTDDAMLMADQDIRFIAENPQALLEKHKPGSTRLPVAVRLSGSFKSAFDARPAGAEGAGGSQSEHLASSVMPANIVLVADVDFLADPYSVVHQNLGTIEFVSALNDNLTFVTNAVDNLKGDANLIGLRSRGKFTRPFQKVLEIEAAAQEEYKDVEARFQQELNSANQRLSALQAGSVDDGSGAVMNEALLAEIDQLREQKRIAQKSLREARRDMREDKEALGSSLFIINTFLLPVVLLIFYFGFVSYRRSKRA